MPARITPSSHPLHIKVPAGDAAMLLSCTSGMPQGPLKQVGNHPIKIALHADVVVTVTVSVLGEQ
ncbi:MAG: hypothetical protein HYY78_18350 [Betaproteobacteria bacterium]|nr:hypothetical protein [Betaproteobacteria bacterium]